MSLVPGLHWKVVETQNRTVVSDLKRFCQCRAWKTARCVQVTGRYKGKRRQCRPHGNLWRRQGFEKQSFRSHMDNLRGS